MPPKKILITGGTGFAGAYIIRQLVQSGYTVRAIRRKPVAPFFIDPGITAQVEWVEGDILDIISLEDAMKGMDAVIHAAGKVSFHAADTKDLYKINIEGTANVVNVAIEKNIQRFIHISSVAAIGRTGTDELVTEKKKWQNGKWNTPYAISKYKGEMEVWRALAEGLNAVILNPSTIIGYGDWNTSSCAIFKNVYKEFPWYTNGVNGFVAVEDVARIAVMLLETGHTNERFIVNGDNWSFRQLFNTIADGFGKKQPHKEATPALGQLAWRIEKLRSMFSGKKPLLTRQTAIIAQSKSCFDNSKITAALPGFAFTPLQETVQNACNQYLAQLQPL
ncbi:MAG: NAD-dependent epimerase/dehydratase family protein [Chitinophagaceae bacterium]